MFHHTDLKQMYLMTPKWHRQLQEKTYPIHVLPVSWSPKFAQFCSMTIHFRVTRQFVTNAQSTTKLPWTLQGQRYPIYALLVSLSSKFNQFLFSQNDLEHFKVKYTLHFPPLAHLSRRVVALLVFPHPHSYAVSSHSLVEMGWKM